MSFRGGYSHSEGDYHRGGGYDRGGGYHRGGGCHRGGGYYRGGRGAEHLRSTPSNSPGDFLSSQGAAALRNYFYSVEGGPYGELKSLTGATYNLSVNVRCTFIAIQSDPFAPGSQICVTCPCPFRLEKVLQSSEVRSSLPCRRVAAEDFILRSFYSAQRKGAAQYRSNALQALRPSQHVLERSTVSLLDTDAGGVEVQFFLRMKIPGHGRRIDGHGAVKILYDELLPIVERGIIGLDEEAIFHHVTCVHDQEYLRAALESAGLVAFVNNGAVLPRDAGDSDKPLHEGAVPFVSPASLERTFTLPHSGLTVTGMGLPRGLTLIAGGGFHGKSTLLRALEVGVYNHVPDDGRTYVVVDPTAVKIRAEDRRSIHGVDISPFITNLPFKKDTTAFSTSDASGSTSQAANIMESLELGSQLLLLDEDTCATNLMYRDAYMQMLVPRDQEPITPFLERVTDLVQNHSISSIMVVGGSGQYFPEATVVLVMNTYTAHDCTARAKEIASASQSVFAPAPSLAESVFVPSVRRALNGPGTFSTVQCRKGRDETKVSAVGTDTIRFSEETIDMSLVEQIVEEGQMNAIAQCLAMLFDEGQRGIDAALQKGKALSKLPSPSGGCVQRRGAFCSDFSAVIEGCEARLQEAMLEIRTPSCYLPRGFTTAARRFEIGAAVNRLRSLRTFAASLK